MALNVYNFRSRPDTVTLDLRGTGISLRQTPRDTYSGQQVTPISSGIYRVQLPAYGFVFLDVAADPANVARPNAVRSAP